MAVSSTGVGLNVHGLLVAIGGDWPEAIDDVRRDFAWFANPTPGRADVTLTIDRRAPDLDEFGDAPASFVTPRNVVYQVGPTTVIDYFGQAVSVLDRRAGHLRIQGERKQLVHEAAYLFLLSRIGEHLDAIARPRLHALGLAGAHGGVAVMLPSGGGKSTLALRALRSDGVKLLSDDSPLIDRRGYLHPFPLRIGIHPAAAGELPAQHVRTIERMEYDPKVVLDVEAFADRVEGAPQPLRHMVLGRRSLGRDAKLERLPRRAVAGALLRESVVGVGLYQGLEFILQRGFRDLPGKARPALVRTRCCMAAAQRAEAWRLTTGRDAERNWLALAPLLT